jgi:hypothetical protein
VRCRCVREYVVAAIPMFTLLALSLILRNIAYYTTSCQQGFAALRKGHAVPLCINFATQIAAVFITEPPKTDSLLVVVYSFADSNGTSATESNGALQETALLMPVRSAAAASMLSAMPAWKVSVDNFNIIIILFIRISLAISSSLGIIQCHYLRYIVVDFTLALFVYAQFKRYLFHCMLTCFAVLRMMLICYRYCDRD